jgi:3-oxoacyl-[acyl-carrier-protein] synthase-3
MPKAYISGVAMNVPDRVVTNDDLVTEFGIDTNDDWIVQRTGIKERRFAPAGVGASDLALPAAQRAIERAQLDPDDIDIILFGTLSPEYAFPGSGVLLQQKLGLRETPAMDLRNACSFFLYALGTGASMIEAGAVKNVLVVGSEIHSAGLDLTTRGRNVATIFGDGAGAVVLSATDEDRGVRRWKLGADGRYAEALAQRVWDTRARPFIPQDADGNGIVSPELMWAQMDGKKVYKHATTIMSRALRELVATERLTVDDLDLVLFHQANMRINQAVQAELGLPDEKVPHSISRYGNTTAATIPMLLAECVEAGRVQKGMKVAMVAFGSGFTWGAALVDW